MVIRHEGRFYVYNSVDSRSHKAPEPQVRFAKLMPLKIDY